MLTRVCLPQWLDEYIYLDLKARYRPSHADMTVIDWDKDMILNYLGTYFPRSYAESYCICRHLFSSFPDWHRRKGLSLFDFGCGTGGEIVGLLMAAEESLPCLSSVRIVGVDGNFHALRLLEKILARYGQRHTIGVEFHVVPLRIDDFYDLKVLDSVINGSYDIILLFKAVCEFVTKECFEQHNPYQHILETFLPRLYPDGVVLLGDVTTYSEVSQEWLGQMMDKGVAAVPDCRVILQNEGYNQPFTVAHSRKRLDRSKIAWRIIQQNL